MSKSSAPAGTTKTNDWLLQDCGTQYELFRDQCYFKMLETLLEDGIISDLTVFFESAINPGRANFVKGAKCFVIPEIQLVDKFIHDDTVIFVRGGFRHWHDFLIKYKGKNWLILYAANTGRQKWTWWDVVMDDLEMANIIDKHGRYQYPFIKPTNEAVFAPFYKDSPKYDICIGASFIHDKKGQYHGVKLMEKFHELYGWFPKAIMPGAVRHSTHTNQMIQDVIYQNEVVSPGMVSKSELCKIYSESKVFLHLGTVGQNDRSVLEAYACGMVLGLKNLKTHTPLLTPNNSTIFHFNLEEKPDYTEWANWLFNILKEWAPSTKKRAFKDNPFFTEIVWGYWIRRQTITKRKRTFKKNI